MISAVDRGFPVHLSGTLFGENHHQFVLSIALSLTTLRLVTTVTSARIQAPPCLGISSLYPHVPVPSHILSLSILDKP